jgi:glycosyltransferase involved in cell wall biosynthesis
VWTDVLVHRPQGWLPGEPAGSLRYAADAIDRLAGAVVLLGIGRFTAVKRLDLLIAAFARARARARRPAALMLVGGHPGEWEGEHPAQTVARLAVGDVYLAGWHDHERLPELCAASDVLVTTSAREQFGLVLVEAMACGLPVVATRSLGPELIVRDGHTGWLVGADDHDRLVDALVSAIDDEPERRRRGEAARTLACERYSWAGITASLAGLLSDVATEGRDAPAARRLT